MKIHSHYAIGIKDEFLGKRGYSYISGLPIAFEDEEDAKLLKVRRQDLITLSQDDGMEIRFAWRSFFWHKVFETYHLRKGFRLVPVDERSGRLLTRYAVTDRELYDESVRKLHGKKRR